MESGLRESSGEFGRNSFKFLSARNFLERATRVTDNFICNSFYQKIVLLKTHLLFF